MRIAGMVFCAVLVAWSAAAELEGKMRFAIEGGMVSGYRSGDTMRSLGIPYAAPPVGELRWKGPQPVKPWDGIKYGDEYGPSCTQSDRLAEIYGMPLGETSENCLYLNVWAPAPAPNAKLAPVMVWLHGGSNTNGSGSTPIYDGTALAAQGVVVVTINYRLGIFGFFAHPDLSDESPNGVSGNYGLLDQVAALQWVQRNISKFGGDQGNVTLFGESAGALDLCLLMASPLTKGLFHKAIAESGHAFGPSRYLKEDNGNRISAEKLGRKIASDIGVKDLAGLRGLSAEQLFEKTKPFVEAGLGGERVDPCVDGWLLPETAASVFESGKQLDIPLIVGANGDEGTIFTANSSIKGAAGFKATAALLFRRYAPEAMKLYPVDDDNVKAVLAEAMGDMTFVAGARRFARLMGTVPSNAWLYHFTHVADTPMGKRFGAFHGSEIGFAFHTAEGDSALEGTMSAYWANFAKTGDPNGPGLPQWPVYNAKTNSYVELGDTIAARTDLKKEKLDLFDKVYALGN